MGWAWFWERILWFTDLAPIGPDGGGAGARDVRGWREERSITNIEKDI